MPLLPAALAAAATSLRLWTHCPDMEGKPLTGGFVGVHIGAGQHSEVSRRNP